MKSNHDIAIIGAGPAGIAAAIQLKRMGLVPLLIERDRVGGLLWNANLVENYPGFPSGISGPNLIKLFCKQLDYFDIKPKIAHIHKVSNYRNRFILKSVNEDISCQFVVIATGTRPREILLELVPSIRSRIHQELRTLIDMSNKHILIIGGGEAALDQAVNLSRKNRVTILNRRATWKAFPRLIEHVESIPQITCILSTSVYNIAMKNNCNNEPQSCLIASAIQKETNPLKIEADEILFAIGREPNMELYQGLSQNQNLFFCGDVQNGNFRQVSIAVGDGVKSAMKIHQIVSEKL